jgi:hypothetical protein
MDLIYMNHAREDLGVLHDYKLDLAFGEDENDFELTVPAGDHCCSGGFYIYIEGTEYGGVVDDVQSDTAAQEVTYTGRTWHGLLNSKILEPDAGADYLVLTGEANQVLSALIARIGLADLFETSADDSGLTIKSYQMNRYISAYDGIRKMLATVAGKLRFTFSGGKVVLAAVPRGEYTQDGELDSDLVAFKARKHFRPVNHLICLGRGELAAREVVHLYADAAGSIGKAQTFFGLDERTEVYDNSNAESLEDLELGGIEKLQELALSDEIETNFDAEEDQYDVQDVLRATDNVTGLAVTAEIVKKIAVVESGHTTISYEVR